MAGYLARLRRSWFPTGGALAWLALGVLPLSFFQTSIHEGSHCVAMVATGLECAVLAPFPVTLSVGSVYGVTISTNENDPLPLPVPLAAQATAVALIPALRFALGEVSGAGAALLLRLWLLGASVDLLNNTSHLNGRWVGDWSVLAGVAGLSPAAMLAVTALLWALAAWGLFAPLPVLREGSRATLRDLWWIGLVYAAISAAAVGVSRGVDVPESDPTTLWHRVPILLQAVSVVVCLAVAAGCRLTKREAA
jgi:hypothetical protein